MEKILKSLKKYGLTEQEAKIYMTLLQVVEASVFQISEKSGIPRTSTYNTLEALKKRGAVISNKKNGVLYYTPENPKVFIEELEEKKKIISNILPEMANLVDTTKILPVVKLYKGKKGYIKVRNEMLETFRRERIKQITAISSPSDFAMFPNYFPRWIESRKKLGVSARIFLRADARHDKNFQENVADLREVKYLPEEYSFKGTMNIYGRRIALFSLKNGEMNSIIIDSPIITEMFKQFFDLTWTILK